MKATLEFELPEERVELETALKGQRYKDALDAVWAKLFRPRHKHGYAKKELERLTGSADVQQAMDHLEELYREILVDYEVQDD